MLAKIHTFALVGIDAVCLPLLPELGVLLRFAGMFEAVFMSRDVVFFSTQRV